jgi:hypothetical protein
MAGVTASDGMQGNNQDMHVLFLTFSLQLLDARTQQVLCLRWDRILTYLLVLY